jgi:hypothetical protein
MKKGRDRHLKLSFDQANAIGHHLVPIGDEVFHFMLRLQEADFKAFLPRHRFIESFAETPEELDLHRRCVVEIAKERLAQPSTIKIYDDDLKKLYWSPFLQQLREKRDIANGGVPVRELRDHFRGGESVWRREVDPCQRRLLQAEIEEKSSYDIQWSRMLDEERQAIAEEAARYATGLGKLPHTFDGKGRYAFFSAVMERDAASLGFRYDKEKSRPNYPVFSKKITEDWHLCWTIEVARSFVPGALEGYFAPSLGLRSRELRGTLEGAESGEALQFRYAGIVPGFVGGYWKFFCLDELEVAIKAHLHLYGLMAPILENGARCVLGEPTSS